ncbi:MAG: Uroporphyrinogen decarboxylase (URO-D) [candidate division BRC1 bacterium ADurb.BinA364]|nr:MAG: Uroporphyrinogen decarboxylase (URO-D) [candidate division BRC1 bacterium ADurb.BinA364]
MNPRERLLGALRGDRIDRVPLELAGFIHPTRDRIAALADPLRRRIAERVFDESAVRLTHPSRINRLLATPPQRIRSERRFLPDGRTETRQTIDTPKGELLCVTMHDPALLTSWTAKYPVESPADIEKIASVPWELPRDLAPPDRDSMLAAAPDRAIVETRISSPFVCVAGMMKFEMFLEMALTEPAWIVELTEICRQRELDCLRALLARPGIEYVWLGGSEWITPPMASPAIHDALVQEQERSLIEYIHAHSDAVAHVHCHGHVRHALPRVIERGGDYFEPVEPPPDGDITLADAKRLAAGRITLGGNIECRILCNESEEAVETAVQAAFEGGKERFVLRPTEGPSPRLSEREYRNYMKMIDLWEQLSPISS